jgi:hypothetical protein
MAMVPGKRPQQTREQTLTILSQSLISVIDSVVILGVRGYYKDSMGKVGKNDQAMYDDALIVISPSAYKTFNANTDPQKAGQKKAMLAPGRYQFYKGRHRNKYNALRPYPEGVALPCTRDGVKSMCSHTNIHKGGFSDTFSEGCQTLYPSQWNEFIDLVYSQMNKYGQKTVRYLLIEN